MQLSDTISRAQAEVLRRQLVMLRKGEAEERARRAEEERARRDVEERARREAVEKAEKEREVLPLTTVLSPTQQATFILSPVSLKSAESMIFFSIIGWCFNLKLCVILALLKVNVILGPVD